MLGYRSMERKASKISRWMRVTEVIEACNEPRGAHIIPSELICVDESMTRWYGLGRDWRDIWLPHYVAMHRELENGVDLQISSRGRSGIITRIENLISAGERSMRKYKVETLYGTDVTLRLVEPWFESERIACAHSYFELVETEHQLFHKGLKCTGVLKISTTGFPWGCFVTCRDRPQGWTCDDAFGALQL